MPIRDAITADAADIADIYNHYIEHTDVTFEETAVSADDIKARIDTTIEHKLPWLVYEEAGKIIGYAYASKWRSRAAYRFSTEVTVYLHHEQGGKGFGTQLYRQLFSELKALGYHVAIGGITLPNPASVALHEKMGMTHAGSFNEVGFKFGRRLDVGYWQGILSDLPH